MNNESEIHELPYSVFDLLNWARCRPCFYLDGELSITRLRSFLVGYECGLSQGRLRMRDSEKFYQFQEWLAERLGFARTCQGWCNMLKSKTSSDADAFALFFELLDQFCKENGIEYTPANGPKAGSAHFKTSHRPDIS